MAQATKYTTNYHIDLYSPDDIPNLCDNYNCAMNKIDGSLTQLDNNIHTATSNSDEAFKASKKAEESAKQASQDANVATSKVAEAVTEAKKAQDDVAELAQKVGYPANTVCGIITDGFSKSPSPNTNTVVSEIKTLTDWEVYGKEISAGGGFSDSYVTRAIDSVAVSMAEKHLSCKILIISAGAGDVKQKDNSSIVDSVSKSIYHAREKFPQADIYVFPTGSENAIHRLSQDELRVVGCMSDGCIVSKAVVHCDPYFHTLFYNRKEWIQDGSKKSEKGVLGIAHAIVDSITLKNSCCNISSTPINYWEPNSALTDLAVIDVNGNNIVAHGIVNLTSSLTRIKLPKWLASGVRDKGFPRNDTGSGYMSPNIGSCVTNDGTVHLVKMYDYFNGAPYLLLPNISGSEKAQLHFEFIN